MIKRLLDATVGQMMPTSPNERSASMYRNLIRSEAKIGGKLFGKVPKGHRREFFCLDEHTWIWYEEWVDQNGQRHVLNTQYDVRPNGVLKSQNGGHHQQLSEEEAQNLREAVVLYRDQVASQMYNFA